MSRCPPHHFVLGASNGPTVEGRCRYCGEVREFRASLDEEYELSDEHRRRISAAAKRRWAAQREQEQEAIKS